MDLLPCPFCGEIPVMVKDRRFPGNSNGIDAWHVECRNLDCVIYGCDNQYYRKRYQAAEAWNRRAGHKKPAHAAT